MRNEPVHRTREFRTGHFALEEDGDKIADLVRTFLRKHVKR
jgi:hypothetical protein